MRKPNKPFIVMPYREALAFLQHVEESDPMRWNNRLRVTWKKYGASVYLQTDGWTGSDPVIIKRYLQLWAELFPHHMNVLMVRHSMYHQIVSHVAANIPDVVAIPIREWHRVTYLSGRVSIVYQEYMDLVEVK